MTVDINNLSAMLRNFFIFGLLLGLLGKYDLLFADDEIERSGKGEPIQIQNPHYYATVADEYHYPFLMNLIGSIHKIDFDHLGEIAVFDIGLNPEQLKKLENIKKTKVYKVEKTHPNLFDYNLTHPNGKRVRGWYAWKPVAIKQALDMFPYILYLDSKMLVLNSPDNLFDHIHQNGYFFLSTPPHNIEQRITKPVTEWMESTFTKEEQEILLRPDTLTIIASIQGLSRSLNEKYVLPMYRLAFNLDLFKDDGSAKQGFGAGRHDQTLFSIFAVTQKYRYHTIYYDGWTKLQVNGKDVPFHFHWEPSCVNEQTCIYSCTQESNIGKDSQNSIQWMNP